MLHQRHQNLPNCRSCKNFLGLQDSRVSHCVKACTGMLQAEAASPPAWRGWRAQAYRMSRACQLQPDASSRDKRATPGLMSSCAPSLPATFTSSAKRSTSPATSTCASSLTLLQACTKQEDQAGLDEQLGPFIPSKHNNVPSASPCISGLTVSQACTRPEYQAGFDQQLRPEAASAHNIQAGWTAASFVETMLLKPACLQLLLSPWEIL